MEMYLLKSSACLLAFFLFYKLLLEKESYHKFKRYFLLTSLFISFGIPTISFTKHIEIPIVNTIANNSVVQSDVLHIESDSGLAITTIIWIIYLIISVLCAFFFVINLYQLFKKIRSNTKEKLEKNTAVLLKEKIVPHTFFNYIFLNKSDYKEQRIPKSVWLHEESHAQQKHSIDILIIEILQVFLWFNPLIYLYKNAIKLNHEFLADDAVINNGINTKNYQQTLLAFSSNATQLPLASAINYSSIKKRFTVMKTQTSKKTIWLRCLVLLPILAIMLFSFSNKEIIYQEVATKKMVTEYNQLAKKYGKKQINTYHYKEVERLNYIYKLMTPSQKKNAEPFPNFPPPPPLSSPTSDASKAKLPPPPPFPKNGNFYIDDVKVSYEKIKKYENGNYQSVFVRTKDVNGKKLKTPSIHIFTNGYRGVVAPKVPVVKEVKLPPPPYPKNAEFFINDKKVSLKDVNSLDSKTIKTVDIMKLDKNGKESKIPSVYIYTKDLNKCK